MGYGIKTGVYGRLSMFAEGAGDEHAKHPHAELKDRFVVREVFRCVEREATSLSYWGLI